MRKILLAAAGFAALAGVAGVAIAQNDSQRSGRPDFFQADSNNDGVLTRQEFDAASAARFATADANHDGQLAREERRGMHGDRRGRGRHHDGMHGGFMGADANNDGNITRDEFLARPIEHFNRIDANHDGVIQVSERPQHREHAADDDHGRRGRGEDDHGGRHGRGSDDGRNHDSNGDHQLSQSEFRARSASMFDRLDANHDGRVTREEADAAHARHGRGS